MSRSSKIRANSLTPLAEQGSEAWTPDSSNTVLANAADTSDKVAADIASLTELRKKTAADLRKLNKLRDEIVAGIAGYTKLRDELAAEIDGHSDLNEKLAIMLRAVVRLGDVNEVELKEALFPRVPGFKEFLMSVPLSEEDFEELNNDRKRGLGRNAAS